MTEAPPVPPAGGPSRPTGEVFEHARPRLLGLAYRMLGTMADAEDVVQDAWIRLEAADGDIERPEAWLTTVTTRLALDRLRAVRRRREDYVGPWLPEPVVTGPGPEEAAELSDTLTLGFLTLLDQLNPVERAVFLLADVFAVPFVEIGETMHKSEAACRQIASRARRRLNPASAMPRRPSVEERQVVGEFVAAVLRGDVAAAMARLAPDAVLISDGGPTRRAARRPVVGAGRVVRFLVNLSRRYTDPFEAMPATVNGDPGLILSLQGEADTVFAFEVHDGRIAALWAMRNPDKLDHLDRPVLLA